MFGFDKQITQDEQVSVSAGLLLGFAAVSTGQAHFKNRDKMLLKRNFQDY